MDVEKWRTSEKVIEKSKKHYAHFDYRTNLADKWEYISNPSNIMHHGFYPFIHYEQKHIKFSRKTNKKIKSRDICYAAHVDSCIYQYYSFLLNELYNERVRIDGIFDVPVAYRTDLRKSNIDFAKDAIDFIRGCKSCYVMIGDFTGFFDCLDHQYLKTQWCELLGTMQLPADHYKVFRNITKFSKWERDDLLDLNHLPHTRKGVKKLNKQEKVLTEQQFRDNKSHIVKNTYSYGIPQGSPISATLANVYMLEADKKIATVVRKVNGFYMRYSDDFIVVIPISERYDATDVLKNVREILGEIPNLKLEPNKTQYFRHQQGQLYNCGKEIDPAASSENRIINFLGFSFDGVKVTIRAKTISKYYYRLYKKGKTIARQQGVSPKGRHISNRNIYEKYSERGAWGENGNFITYVYRADKAYNCETSNYSKSITRDTKRHMQKIRRAITKRPKRTVKQAVSSTKT